MWGNGRSQRRTVGDRHRRGMARAFNVPPGLQHWLRTRSAVGQRDCGASGQQQRMQKWALIVFYRSKGLENEETETGGEEATVNIW